MKKKRAFTLLEVVISLTLTAILLAVLLGSATRLFVFRHRLESAKQEVLAKKLIQERLTSLFASLEKTKPVSQDASMPRPILESRDGSSLTLRLENVVDPDPSFCGNCQAILEVDRNKRLVLTLIGKKKKERQEALLEAVSGIQFQFFDFNARAKGLIETWKEKGADLPAIIRLTLSSSTFQQNKEASFAFFLDPENTFVVYTKESQ